MICGIRLYQSNISLEHKNFLENKFSFGGYFCIKDGNEISYPKSSFKSNSGQYGKTIWRRAEYRSLTIELGYYHFAGNDNWRLRVYGSIHKYARQGDNSDLFLACNAVAAIESLSLDLQLDKNIVRVTRLEVGFNIIEPSINIEEWISNDLLRYKSHPFESMKSNSKLCIGKEAVLSQKSIKIYSKGNNTLRYEIHYNDMDELRGERNSIYTLSDLTIETINDIAATRLLPAFEEIVSLDGIEIITGYFPAGLRETDKKALVTFSNQKVIDTYESKINAAKATGNLKLYEKLKKRLQRGRLRFKTLIAEHTGSNAHEKINSKLVHLLAMSQTEKCPFSETRIKIRKGTIISSPKELIKYTGKERIERIKRFKERLLTN